MNIILSRKGFDSTAGGKASPIWNGKFISIPIPYEGSNIFYKDLNFDKDIKFIQLMKDLKINYFSEAHLDPDLRKSAMENRLKNWRPIFGQDDNSQTILKKGKVGIGDIFLFFGWFKRVVKVGGKYKYQKGAPDVHAIYGYLEVDDIIEVNSKSRKIPQYAMYHPHVFTKNELKENNTIYIAKETSSIDVTKPGAAFFKYNEKLILTDVNQKRRSIWRLPDIFENELNSFNAKVEQIEKSREHIIIDTNKGRTMQEIYVGNNGNIVNWARQLIKSCDIYK